jgi:hypothetical protein
VSAGRISDVSPRGIFVATDTPAAIGTDITVFVPLPDQSTPAVLCGQVVWTTAAPPKGPGMGIRLERAHDPVTADEVLRRVHFKSSENMVEVPSGAAQLAILGPPRLDGDLARTFPAIMAEVRRTLREDGVVAVWNADHYENGRIVLVHDVLRETMGAVGFRALDHKILLRHGNAKARGRSGFWHLQIFSVSDRPWRVETEAYAANVWIHTRPQAVNGFEDGLNPDVSEILIRAFTRPGDLVLAPFAGSGTNLAVALGLRREAVGYEINPAMRETIVKRTTQLDDFYTGMNDVMSFVMDSFLKAM